MQKLTKEFWLGFLLAAFPMIFVIGILCSQLNAVGWKTTAQICQVTLEHQTEQFKNALKSLPSEEK